MCSENENIQELFLKVIGLKPKRQYSIDEKMEYYEKRFYDLSLPSSIRSYAKKRYLELEKIKYGKR